MFETLYFHQTFTNCLFEIRFLVQTEQRWFFLINSFNYKVKFALPNIWTVPNYRIIKDLKLFIFKILLTRASSAAKRTLHNFTLLYAIMLQYFAYGGFKRPSVRPSAGKFANRCDSEDTTIILELWSKRPLNSLVKRKCVKWQTWNVVS